MNYLEHLKKSLSPQTELGPPQNLAQLSERLCRCLSAHEPQLAEYCVQFGQRCRQTRQANAQELGHCRGKLLRLWKAQDETYLDLEEHLEQAAQLIRRGPSRALRLIAENLDLLLNDLRTNLDDMNLWRTSKSLRCLGCGWSDSQEEVCPHCQVTILKPVRKPRGEDKCFAPLQGTQFELYQGLSEVLAGSADLDVVWEPLEFLQDQYEQFKAELDQVESPEELSQTLAVAMAGLDLMAQTFEDLDAQNLEDGWHAFFQAERQLSQMLPAPAIGPSAISLEEVVLTQEA